VKMFDINKIFAIKVANDMQKIATPLRKNFNITYFGYLKAYLDGTHFVLSTSPEWLACFYDHFYAHGVAHKNIDAYHSGYFLWSEFSDQTTVSVMQNHFNFAQGISIIKKQEDCCETFSFATSANNASIKNWYLNNIDLLEKFILYFKEQAHDILLLSERKDRFLLPIVLPASPNEIYVTIPDNTARQNFLNEINGVSSCLDLLSKQQKECLRYLVKGMSTKKIAQMLQLSPRTVEHYLDAVKTKFRCGSQMELIDKVFKLGAAQVF
jgi:DNA-binding CsgD family transcriptional regulator